MILKGSQRGGSTQLAAHLLKTHDNEHVEVHELRGFMADDLGSALHEAYAVSRGTRAKQFLFSLSLSPPPQERVSIEAFEAAIDAAEKKLGLEDQPRAVVFHEKDGRRHAHVVWSRIRTQDMKAINLPHFKLKLRDVSRDLYLEHGWRIPRGLVNSRERDPTNYSRAEWEQAKRARHDPRALKAMFQECWAISDGRKAFAQALQARGYYLAQGDRRGHVAMDFRGEVYAVAQWVGLKTKEVRGKLGDEKELPTLNAVKTAIADRMTGMLRGHIADAETARQKQTAALAFHKSQIVDRQRKERADLEAGQRKRWDAEIADRASRLNRGFRGIWDRIIGKHARQIQENERAALDAMRRDRKEKDALIEHHIVERASFHQLAKQSRASHTKEIERLHRDIADFMQIGEDQRQPDREEFRSREPEHERPKRAPRKKDRGPDRGPER
jgi:hypothetical protein